MTTLKDLLSLYSPEKTVVIVDNNLRQLAYGTVNEISLIKSIQSVPVLEFNFENSLYIRIDL